MTSSSEDKPENQCWKKQKLVPLGEALTIKLAINQSIKLSINTLRWSEAGASQTKP